MAVFVQDTFTGTDATTLQSHTPDVGTQWEATSISADGNAKTTNAEINTNRARCGTTNTPSRVYRSPDDPGTAEYDVIATFTIGSAGSGDVPALMARMDPTGTTSLTFYGVRYLGQASAGNRRWQLYKVVDDVIDVTIATDFNEDLAGTTVTVKFQVRDAAKKLFIDYGAGYVERISTTDNTITQNGRVGLVCASHRSNVNYIDNFSAETAGGTDATAMPGVITAAVSMPAASGQGHSTQTPASVATTAAVPALTTSAGSTLTPAVTPATVTAPQATPSAGSTPTPGVISAPATLPQATPGESATRTPEAITGIVISPQAAPSAGSTLTPETIQAIAALAQAGVTTGATTTPDGIATVVTIPQVTVGAAGNATVQPATITSSIAVPAVALSTGATASPDVTAATVSLPVVTLSASALVIPETVSIEVTLPAVSTGAGATATPSSLAVVCTVPQSSTLASASATPAVVTLLADVLAPGASAGAEVTPQTIETSVVVYLPEAGLLVIIRASEASASVTQAAGVATGSSVAQGHATQSLVQHSASGSSQQQDTKQTSTGNQEGHIE